MIRLIGEQEAFDSVITPHDSEHGIGLQIALNESSTTGTAAWPLANLAIYLPIEIYFPVVVTGLGILTTTAAGNRDMGIYSADGRLVVSTGSVSVANANSFNPTTVADTLLPKGFYFLAVAFDGTTVTMSTMAISSVLLNAWGVREQQSAFPLPSSFTLASMARAYFPYTAIMRLKYSTLVFV